MRLVSWNLHGGIGLDGVLDFDRQVEALAELKPDVLCLQEVHQRLPWSKHVDMPKFVTQKLEFSVTFAYTQSFFGGHYGNVIATRHPVNDSRTVTLPNYRERFMAGLLFEGRNALIVSYMGVNIGVTHWSLIPGDRLSAAVRLGNVYLELEGPKILVGDLNAVADSREFREFERHSGMQSCVDLSYTFPSKNPQRKIDHVLSDFEVTVTVGSPEMGALSDHLPLICDW